jgi:DNA (cytosine-5)-methyltransferase 1
VKFISLFAGIGGFDLGFERAGMECVAQVEIDEFCQKVLAKHWPNVPKFGDIRDVGKHNLPAADLICGGFPCQPHSLAGKRKGSADDRDLWPEYRRIIGELKPAWVVGENVPGIRTTILDQVLSDLESMDYSTRALVVPACAFNAPHRRSRVFIVGYPKCKSRREKSKRRLDMAGELFQRQGWEEDTNRTQTSSYDVSNPDGARLAQREGKRSNARQEQSPAIGANWWATEPDVGRMVDGLPNRVDRLRSLGNAVVPQVAEFIGRAIMEAEGWR